MNWKQEIEELHDFFELYLGGPETSLERVKASLGEHFTIIGPAGDRQDRAETLASLAAGQGKVAGLTITTTDHQLIHANDDVVVAGYIEQQQVGEHMTRRWSTVIFHPDPQAPNGLIWTHLQETMISDNVD